LNFPRAWRVAPWGFLCLLLACNADRDESMRLLTWNIGNPGTDDPHYAFRLKHQEYEDFVRDRIRAAAPEVVLLQEVLSPSRCDAFVEPSPFRTCHDAANRPPPIRRLLGPGYSIACDARRQVECIAVRTSFGGISGVPLGGLRLKGAETLPLPLVGCDRLRGECDDDRCDVESSVSAATVETKRGRLRLIHVHPMAPGKTGATLFWGEPCRYLQLRQAFDGFAGAMAKDGVPTVIAGDFNLDPVRLIGERETALWSAHVGENRRFKDLTPSAPNGSQYGTRRGSFGMAIDHVLVDRGRGACTVHGHGVGPDPGTSSLDAGFAWSNVPDSERRAGQIDHFAITCDIMLDRPGQR
jgi:hypothetical protein